MRKYAFILLFWVLFLPFPVFAGDIAIIVNPKSSVEKINFYRAQQIFKLEIQYLEGRKVVLVLQDPETPEMKVVLKKIYRISHNELSKFWLSKLFKGEILRPPRILKSHEEVTRFISSNEGGIGFIDASYVNERVKVLRIDGKLPGEEGYILHDKSF